MSKSVSISYTDCYITQFVTIMKIVSDEYNCTSTELDFAISAYTSPCSVKHGRNIGTSVVETRR